MALAGLKTRALSAGLRRRLAWMVLLGVLGGLLGGWWGSQRSNEHEATAAILVAPLLGNPFSPEVGGDQLVNLSTEAQLVTSDTMAELVSRHLPGNMSVAAVLAGVSVDIPTNTQVLQITVASRSSEDAIRRTQAFATSYLSYRLERARSAVDDRTAQIQNAIDRRTTLLNASVSRLDKLAPRSAHAVTVRQQVVDLTSQIGDLRQQQVGLRSTSQDPGQVVRPAAITQPWLDLSVFIGAALGFLVGLGIGFGIPSLPSGSGVAVRSPRDLAGLDATLGSTLLGAVSEGDADSFRRLRSAFLGSLERSPAVVLVESATGGDDRVRCTQNLAKSLGAAGLEVVLVDLTPRTGGQSLTMGLSDLVLDRCSVDDALVQTSPYVAMIGPGTRQGALDDLVDSLETDVLIEELRKRADVVLLAATAPGVRSRALARRADAVLLEVVEGDKLATVSGAVRDLADGGHTLLGLVYVARGSTRPRSSVPAAGLGSAES